MSIRDFEFTLTGRSDLLMHKDDIVNMSRIQAWQKNPKNKNVSIKGDDRSPAWVWIAYTYINDGFLSMPTENVMAALKEAGKQLTMPGKGKKSFKAETQSSILVAVEHFDFFIGKKKVESAPIQKMWENTDFEAHEALAEKLGFKLFVKRAKIGTSKHVRVRPRFSNWSVKGKLSVTDDVITDKILEELLGLAGDKCGIGDWRPSSQSPGPFGRFEAKVTRV